MWISENERINGAGTDIAGEADSSTRAQYNRISQVDKWPKSVDKRLVLWKEAHP
jgi:hypothetical protein